MGRVRIALLAALVGACATAPAAHATKTCSEPGQEWERATPAEADMDAAKLQDAIDYGSTQASYAIRVYRHGCLVGEDRLADRNRHSRYQSWSMAKSVTSMIFGRAMTLGLMSPDDPVGSLVPEADEAHGEITIHDLLTMTSGLKWNGLRDYNIFTMPDRVRDALTLEIVKPHGTYFEYAQSAVALLAKAVGNSAGEDVMAFGQRELMTPLGIEEGSWDWTRDRAGNIQGFYGVMMTPDDYGRLGDLFRRGGVWRGRRLLSRDYVRRAVEPSKTNGCYGWLIWVNAAAPCIGPTVEDRGIEDTRDFTELPADFYNFSGLFGQRVTVFPTQDIVIVRTGQDPGMVPTGQPNWENELYKRVLAAMTDQTYEPPADAPRVNEENEDEDVDYGFGQAISEPDQYSKGAQQDALPPAGPARARAAIFGSTTRRVRRHRIVRVSLRCPPVWPMPGLSGCRGVARLAGAKRRPYKIAPGATKKLRFRLSRKIQRRLRRKGSLTLAARARNADAAGGTVSHATISVRKRRPRPRPTKPQPARSTFAQPENSPAGANDFACEPTAEYPEPVVLVHGLGATMQWNWGYMSPRLADEGYCVFALTYGRKADNPPPFDQNGGLIPMEESALELAGFIDEVLAATGAPQVDIVGHSEGSLMPNYYVKFLPQARYEDGSLKVDDYVGITPLWDGTNLAGLGTLREAAKPSGSHATAEDLVRQGCESCPQFVQGSDFMTAMNDGPTGPRVPGVTYTMLMTRYDQLVVPYTSGYMDGATNIVMQDQCAADPSEHVAMAFNANVLRNILNALDPANPRPVDCSTFFQS